MNDTPVSNSQGAPHKWLLIITLLPAKPDYLRVKLQRRMQKIGATSLKNSVYLLPYSKTSLEDFAWIREELRTEGGNAMVWSANALLGVDDAELNARFNQKPRVWVTRSDVFVDRMASAWLILRFIDANAKFKFVDDLDYKPGPSEARFDMFAGEYTHEGDRCTFETLLQRFGLDEWALKEIGEIVHDVDCKDGKFARAEAAGIELVLSGITSKYLEDNERIAAGLAVFDALYNAAKATNVQ